MAVLRRARQTGEILVENGTLLMKALLDAGIPVASSCGGDAVCCKCLLKIVAGAENLSAPNREEEFLREQKGFAADERVSCQVLVLGDVTVDARYW